MNPNKFKLCFELKSWNIICITLFVKCLHVGDLQNLILCLDMQPHTNSN